MSTNEVEVKAKDLGWVPKEGFRGDPDKWIDAEEFVRRGEELMPLLKATTRKQSEKISQLETQLAAATDAIEALKETTSKAAIKEVKAQHTELKEALKEARAVGDVDAEEDIREKLEETKRVLKEAELPPTPKKPEEPTKEHPDFLAWKEENNWFGQDKRRTALALGIAQELRESGEKSLGRDFYDKVSEELNAMLGGSRRESPSKVEGDARGSAGGGKGGKSYNELPQEAKDACERQANRVVGEGRAFKTITEWRKHYVTKFFEE